MQKRRPGMGGVDLLGGDHAFPTQNRRCLQANEAMRTRLNWHMKLSPYPAIVRRRAAL